MALFTRTNVLTSVPVSSPMQATGATGQATVSEPQPASDNKREKKRQEKSSLFSVGFTGTTDHPSPVGLPDSILSQGGSCLHSPAPLVVAAVGLQQVQHPVAHHLCVSSLCTASQSHFVNVQGFAGSSYLTQTRQYKCKYADRGRKYGVYVAFTHCLSNGRQLAPQPL